LIAAGELLSEQGASGMQVRAIAGRTGLSVGSIYKLFGDVESLMRELNRETYRAFAEHHRSALEACGLAETRVLDRLMVLARAYIDFVLTHRERWTVLLALPPRRHTESGARDRASEDALFAIVEEVLAPAAGMGDSVQRARIARAMWASVHGIVSIVLTNSVEDDPVADALAQIEMIVGAVVRDHS